MEIHASVDFIDHLFLKYLKDRHSVSPHWQKYFDSLNAAAQSEQKSVADVSAYERILVNHLIDAYRKYGYAEANTNPLDKNTYSHPMIVSAEKDIQCIAPDTLFSHDIAALPARASLADIHSTLKSVYCRSIGFDFSYVQDVEEYQWLSSQAELKTANIKLTDEQEQFNLKDIIAAEGLERHLESKYPGVKRFSLEGGEALIPLLNHILQSAGSASVKEVVIGMAHRGRLNVLVNILGKEPTQLFNEFEGKYSSNSISGDVKYHLGFSSDVITSKGKIHLALSFNPSHLEIITPVVQGGVRARIDKRKDSKMMAIVLHGDASFAGQGVIMESMQMAHNPAFKIGGTLHIVINNQIGFTISKKEEARSTYYCTDIAKTFSIPVFHVNAHDLDAVFCIAQIATEYRMKFNKDIIIDLVCYRLRGHNETDDPSVTQPEMYSKIKKTHSSCSLYIDKLIKNKKIDMQQADKMTSDYRDRLEQGKPVAPYINLNTDETCFVDWTPHLEQSWDASVDTSFASDRLKEIGRKISTLPDNMNVHNRVKKVYSDRLAMAQGELACNWGMAELLAYASLSDEGHAVRLVGQDSERGTFSHRHAVVHDQTHSYTWKCLDTINVSAPIEIYNSLLSEEAVLAFEYGYATTNPNTLVLWEAQFGDFVNGAQVVIDQFIASSEHKWSRYCGLTMLLPHGYEGQGAEHSSARLERFLQLCAHQNIQVCNPTLPSQIFHLLRRQMIRPMRRPLIIMSPKSLLRHNLAVSSLEDLSQGKFMNMIDDNTVVADDVTKIIACSGKIFYELLAKREEKNLKNIAIIRLEQIYPFPFKESIKIFNRYKNIKNLVWCQEEPLNQGIWYSSKHHIHQVIKRIFKDIDIKVISRDMSSSPASGYMSRHMQEQRKIIDEAIV